MRNALISNKLQMTRPNTTTIMTTIATTARLLGGPYTFKGGGV